MKTNAKYIDWLALEGAMKKMELVQQRNTSEVYTCTVGHNQEEERLGANYFTLQSYIF